MKKLVSANTEYNNKRFTMTVLYEEDEAAEIAVENGGIRCGNIYVGYVENVPKTTGGAFVRSADGATGYLPPNRMKDVVFKNIKKDDVIKPGDEIIVQVETESIGEKHAVLSCRLKGNRELLDELKEKGIHRTCGTCLYRAPSAAKMFLDRYKKEAFSRIVTDNEDIFGELKGAAAFYDDRLVSLYKLYNFSTLLDRSLEKKVWLPCGGFLYIEQTEAFVSIDVNSGKAVKGIKDDERFLQINLEAAYEAAGQIRRRGLSGTILIDFISMKSKEANDRLLEEFRSISAADPVYTNAVDITSLGIMEITRHKVKRPLKRQLECAECSI